VKTFKNIPLEAQYNILHGGAGAFAENFGAIYEKDDHDVLLMFIELIDALREKDVPQRELGEPDPSYDKDEFFERARAVVEEISPELATKLDELMADNKINFVAPDDPRKMIKKNVSCADYRTGKIDIDPISLNTDIGILAHELGHIVLPQSDDDRISLLEELVPSIIELLAADILGGVHDIHSCFLRFLNVRQATPTGRLLKLLEAFVENGKLTEEQVTKFAQAAHDPEILEEHGGYVNPSGEFAADMVGAGYFVSSTSAIACVQKIRDGEMSLEDIFAIMRNDKLNDTQKLGALGITAEAQIAAINSYVLRQLNLGFDLVNEMG
jgi:hypothetical protein